MYRITTIARPTVLPWRELDEPVIPWCTCAHPHWIEVRLFGTILLGCHECARCGRPDRDELGRH